VRMVSVYIERMQSVEWIANTALGDAFLVHNDMQSFRWSIDEEKKGEGRDDNEYSEDDIA